MHAEAPPAHDQFRVAVYIPVGVVEKMKDPAYLEKSWQELSSQVKVDKVYIESYRSGQVADGALLEKVKRFFVAHGVQVAGGIAYVGVGDNAGGAGKKSAAPDEVERVIETIGRTPAGTPGDCGAGSGATRIVPYPPATSICSIASVPSWSARRALRVS